MQTRHIYHRSFAEGEAAARCAELASFFGVPYALYAVWGNRYSWERRRLRQSDPPIGCLNQPWSGPAVVWYPAGNWMLPPANSWTSGDNA